MAGSDGVNYLEDLLRAMTRESGEFDSLEDDDAAYNLPPPVADSVSPSSEAVSVSSSAAVPPPLSSSMAERPESFRGDFDYLEMLLNDIGGGPASTPTTALTPADTSYSPSSPQNAAASLTDFDMFDNMGSISAMNTAATVGGVGGGGSGDAASRASTRGGARASSQHSAALRVRTTSTLSSPPDEFDLEGTLKELEDTFSGKEPSTRRTLVGNTSPQAGVAARPTTAAALSPNAARASAYSRSKSGSRAKSPIPVASAGPSQPTIKPNNVPAATPTSSVASSSLHAAKATSTHAKKDDYMDILDELVNMNYPAGGASSSTPAHAHGGSNSNTNIIRTASPPVQFDDASAEASVEENMYEPLASESPAASPPSAAAATAASSTSYDDEFSTPLLDEEMSYLDQMINSFGQSPPSASASAAPAIPEPTPPPPSKTAVATAPPANKSSETFNPDNSNSRASKSIALGGVQVLPMGAIPTASVLKPVTAASATGDVGAARTDAEISSLAAATVVPPAAAASEASGSTSSLLSPSSSEAASVARMTRAPVPVSASTPAPSRVPALRTTATSSPSTAAFARSVASPARDPDDLLDEVIHSFAKDDTLQSPNREAEKQRTSSVSVVAEPAVAAAAAAPQDELLDQILSNDELNIAKIEHMALGGAGKEWLIPFGEIEQALQAKLGVGNHGETYRPYIWRGKKVVVKKWATGMALSPQLIDELSALLALNHTNVVPPVAVSCDGRAIYTVSEYIAGAHLHGFLQNGGLSGEQDPIATIVRLARSIAEGMAFLHSQSIIHRSLAPKNILLDINLVPRIRDFGLASLKEDIWLSQRVSNARFPLYDSQYIAPELMRGAPYTMQVDIFSFGVLLWEAFAGESALDGLVLRDLSGCPFAIQKMIKLCVSPSPTARPSFATIVKILSQPLQTLLSYARPSSSALEPSGFFAGGGVARPSSHVRNSVSGFAPSTNNSHPPTATASASGGVVAGGASAAMGGNAGSGLHAPPLETNAFDEAEEEKKLQKVMYAVADLTRTPSDQAQLKAAHAIEQLAQKEWNLVRLVKFGFVPNVVDVLRSRFGEVQETGCRVVASMLKNFDFCQSFLSLGGLGILLELLSSNDDGVRLVATKALTIAAYTAPDLTRNDAYAKNGASILTSLLRTGNEFVRVQAAWALSQLLAPAHPLTEAFFTCGGFALLCTLLLTGGSPAAELRALTALLPVLVTPRARTALPPSLPRKIAQLLASQQAPLRQHALRAASLLVQDYEQVPSLLETHGLAIALIALIQPVRDNPLLLPTLELLRSIAEARDHAMILLRAGVGNALRYHLASEDAQVLQAANALYNLLV